MNPDGAITTVAGTTGVFSFSGDGGPVTKARLDLPIAVAVNREGNLYFCVVVLFAHRMMADQPTEIVRRAAWYDKRYTTFSEALALVRKELWVWQEQTFSGSPREDEMVKVSQASESTL